MKLLQSMTLLALGLVPLAGESFSERFEEIKKTPDKQLLYQFLWNVPKGGDLHNHMQQSFMGEQWFEFATNPAILKGNRYYTQLRFTNCAGADPAFVVFRTIQRSTWERLPACEKAEYEPLDTLSGALKEQWISSLKLDKPGEGRTEFFEVIGRRRGEMGQDPNLVLPLLLEHLKYMQAQNMPYLETQFRATFRDQAGNAIPDEAGIQLMRDFLNTPAAKATGVTVRFLNTISRFAANAEQQVEAAYAYIAGHRDLWVGMNMAGREDNDKGFPKRFMDIHRRMRRQYSGIHLSFHGGEVDSPGEDVRYTLLLGAERIGHGVNLISDPETMLLMRNNRYLVEINLISNNLLEYVPDLDTHPFPEYLRLGIPVCLNTDDPGQWDSNITDEYFTAVTHFNLTWQEVVQLGRNSLTYSFIEEPAKAQLLAKYEETVRQFEARYSGDWKKEVSMVHPKPSGYAHRTLGIK